MPDSSFKFGHLVSEFAHAAQNGPPIQPQGQEVSSFVHALIPPDPIEPLGQDVSSFVHELHGGSGSFSFDAMGWML